MSALEGRTKKAFSAAIKNGSPNTFSLEDVVTLAAFAFKCSVIASHMNSDREPFFTRASRERFRTSLQIPETVQTWTARYTGTHGYTFMDARVVGPNIPPSHSWFGLEFYVFTYVAGRLAFQVHIPRWEGLHQRGRILPIMQPRELRMPFDLQFWPNGSASPIEWPAAQDLTDDSIDTFVNRWMGKISLAQT
jgi:hypothetical protein